MMSSQYVRTPRRAPGRRRGRVVFLALVLAGSAVAVGVATPAFTGLGSGADAGVVTGPPVAPPPGAQAVAPAAEPAAPATGRTAGQGSVFDDGDPGIRNLDPALLSAIRAAATDAAADGVGFHVNSGWRSAAEQQALLDEAVEEYGSLAAAERWVATPETSQHVSGDAVDIGPTAADTWLSQHGAAYGLCQIYANEPWHFELRPAATGHGCPPLYADPTADPRMLAR